MRRTAGHFEALLAVCAAALAAGCDEATHPAPREEQRATNSVAYLKSLCDGRNSVVVTQEITVQGYVAANDRYGEFTKSLVIEDATGGITVAADLESVADVCPFGYVATLRCHGLVLCDYGGKIQIGRPRRQRRRPHSSGGFRPLRQCPDAGGGRGAASRSRHDRPDRGNGISTPASGSTACIFRRRREMVRHRPRRRAGA